MERREPVLLQRVCDATQIPSGFQVQLAAGAYVIPQQVLDGNITVMTERAAWRASRRPTGTRSGRHTSRWLPGRRRARGAGPGSLRRAEGLGRAEDGLRPEIPASIVDLGLVYLVESEPVEAGRRWSSP